MRMVEPTVRLIAVGSPTRPIWEQLCASNGDLAVSQTPAWCDCVCQERQFVDATRLYETRDGRVLILPLARRRSVPQVLTTEESWPWGWGGYGDLLGADEPRPEDVEGVVSDLLTRSVGRTTVLSTPRPAPNDYWTPSVSQEAKASRRRRTVHILNLDGGFDRTWTQRFTSKARSASRKAERRGVELEFGNSERLVANFDELYRESVERWATDRNEPVAFRRWLASRREPRTKLQIVASRLGADCQFGVAYRDGQAISGIIVLTNGSKATYWRGAMNRELAVGSGANELLHRTAIEQLCARGFQSYDFGTSPSEGVARFKMGFGSEEWYQHEYRFERIPVTRVTDYGRKRAKRLSMWAAARLRPVTTRT